MNVAMPSVYVFLAKVIDDLKDIYRKADIPLTMVHVGGDEVPAGVWEGSPICRELMKKENMASVDDLWYYYFRKVNKILVEKGLKMYGWEEIGMRKTMLDGAKLNIPNPDFVNDNFMVDVWNNVLGWGAEDLAYKLANAGYKVVLSQVSNYYFDMAYQKSFDEPGYYWGGFVDVDKPFYFIPFDYFKNAQEDLFGNPLDRSIFIGKERLNDYGKSNITGIQGLIWSENMISNDRLEYMLLPKLLGMAERAWAPSPSWSTEKDSSTAAKDYSQAWSVFVNTLAKRELPKLDYLGGGFNYRIPEPGVIIQDGKVIVNSEFPGMQIRYTTDGTDPVLTSKIYEGPIEDNGKVKVRLFNTRGRGGRISIAR
jgi:hexosaminidase